MLGPVVLGWVIVFGRVNHLGMAFNPFRVGKMKNSFGWEGKGIKVKVSV